MGRLDALNYLPSTRIVEYPRRCAIYEPARPASRLYLLLAGRVKVFCTADNGSQTLLRVAGPEEFLGESSLVPSPGALRESAVVVDSAQAMAWTPEEVEERIERVPKLALALAEYFGRNNGVLSERITTIANYKTGPRVVLALIQISRSVGVPTPGGALRITGLTHQAIADYVGTSREIVTSEMNRLRRLGYLSYSRLYTDVFADALAEWMRQQGTSAHAAAAEGHGADTLHAAG
ncbi:MAG TPA: Crp/Fnr family transcriptional regulator [Bryobacteraceae bacterium]|jgi:CRP/FNR family transcriptional regulator|nr:Crp/Fnr family transcriptional regulator [Bryobacteraceae bacterium]